MATFVETKGGNILIDPGVSLAPKRFRLPPHPLEVDRMKEHWAKIKGYARRSKVLIVTHYHYDHHNPNEPEIYEGKVVLLKHPQEKINRSQRERSAFFLGQLGDLPAEVHCANGQKFSFGKTEVKLSPPVFHGTNPKLGYVLEVSIEEDYKFVFTSDVEGPAVEEQAHFILEEDPEVVFCDGPMTYMLGYRYSRDSLQKAVDNLVEILQRTSVRKLVLDHHFLRDLGWRERVGPILEAAEKKGVAVLTAAEFAGLDNDLLEAKRRELYRG